MTWRAWALVLPLALLAVIVLGSYWLFTQPGGTRWSIAVIEQLVPGLSIQWRAGSWRSGLQVESLRYRASNLELAIDQLQLALVPAALGAGELKLRNASAASVSLQLIDDDSPPAEELPRVAFPVTLTVGELTVEHFELLTSGGAELKASFSTGLQWRDTELSLAATELLYQAIVTRGELMLDLDGDYAVAAALTLAGEPLPAPLQLELGGSLASLGLQAHLGGAYPLTVMGQAEILEEGIPLQLEAHNSAPWQLSVAEESIDIDGLQLSLTGVLDQLAGEGIAHFNERRFGASEVALAFAWQHGELQLNPLRWQAGDQGAIAASCLIVPEQSRWSCDGALEELDLAPLGAAIEGHLQAGFEASGSWAEDGLALNLDLPQLGGRLHDQALAGELHLSSRDFTHWRLEPSRLQLADNLLSLQGDVGDSLALQLTLSAPQLSQIVPVASGTLVGELSISGTVQEPNLVGTFSGEQLSWEQWDSSGLSVDIDVAQLGRGESSIELLASGLTSSGQALGALEISLVGTRAGHVIAADLAGGSLAQARLRCDGGQQRSQWELACNTLSGEVLLEGQQRPWSLDRPLELQLNNHQELLAIQPFCLRMEPASLCLESGLQRQGPELQSMQVELRQLPVAWWSAWLPAPFELVDGGIAQGQLALDSLQPLAAKGSLSVNGLALEWAKGEQRKRLAVETLEAEFDLDAARANLTAVGLSNQLGELRIAATVEDPADSKSLQGSVHWDGLKLAALDGLLPEVQHLGGAVETRMALSGTVVQPVIEGQITLEDGIYQQLGLPYPAEDITATVDLRRDHADFSLAFVVNDGSGSGSGRIDWRGADTSWRGSGRLLLDAISIGFLEDSVANVSSDLQLGVEPGKIEVAGDIKVNEADIHLLSLPPESIGPSPDAEIIGLEDGPDRWQINADIAVDLGDHLRFRGFGADLQLAGELEVRNSRRELVQVLGEVRVSEGFYRAYGQRLKIRRGSLLFAGPIDNPDLQLEAIRETRSRDVVGGLRVTGTLQEPIGELFSEPPMAETDIAHFILTGRVRSSTERFGQGSAEGTLLSLGLAGANEPAAELARRFGINDFQISAENSEAGTETRVSGYLTPNLFISYGTVLKDRSNTVTLQYFITPNIIVEAVSGFSSALDFIYNFAIE